MDAAKVTIEAPVRPTEDATKVANAVLALFPDAEIQTEERWVRASATSIKTLIKKTTEERVRDAARGALWRGRLDDRSSRFELNKQAAAMGRVNFNEVQHPLGDLIVTVEVADLEGLLDAIAPPTRAELVHRERDAATTRMRAAMHQEETQLEKMGTDVDSGWDELEDEAFEEWDDVAAGDSGDPPSDPEGQEGDAA